MASNDASSNGPNDCDDDTEYYAPDQRSHRLISKCQDEADDAAQDQATHGPDGSTLEATSHGVDYQETIYIFLALGAALLLRPATIIPCNVKCIGPFKDASER